ncbi:LuxR family transcriptional regulator [Burkholderia glumae]|uniref:LuxR family transcriptional regulator n=2 Tax=Burkholderia glumae TaxID=337 RepID=A0AAP9XWM0_BURGL|nr:LuxR family transcriptional regulator [Burkholderia glumae]ACR32265.1 Autoinducer-binding domain-containing protein [Burkholderia glumae BGR1]AJY63191.1 bacterial regulatory s, luxR family protein [Burkholderia glumae LMG 2196 = ATCC 33617]KHJ61740.1 autoinducer-binding protein [Burkholderia glumae]MCM2484545.1 LuxR family transcriptional regulator [Burkholderia glumae]MCM2494925.1 LuxR family transcriptional regulator [Burkholderia glumae]
MASVDNPCNLGFPAAEPASPLAELLDKARVSAQLHVIGGGYRLAAAARERGDTPESLLDAVLPIARRLGFAYLEYFFNTSLPVSAPRKLVIGNFPPAWSRREGADEVSEANPIIARCKSSMMPMAWDEASFASHPDFRAMLARAGIGGGWSQLVRDGAGNWGVLTVARTACRYAGAMEVEAEAQLLWLAHIVHSRLCQMLRPPMTGANRVLLTEMEKTILRWTVDGKTSGELAEILQVSARTVNFHVQNILAKMNTCNKTAAAAQAALLGLLY